jgi:signal transduction histidine kinase
VSRRLTALLVLIVVLPTGVLAWLAIRGVRDERGRVAGQLRAAAESRLADVDARIQRVLEDRARRLLEVGVFSTGDTDGWREFARTTPEVTQVAVQAADGRLLHPPLESGLSDAERDFLLRIRQILVGRLLGSQTERIGDVDTQQVSLPAADHGWYAWYWDTGLHLIFWQRGSSGRLIAVELDRVRLLADLLVELSTDPGGAESSTSWGRIVLEDSQGRVIFQSAAAATEGISVDAVERRLSPPLGAWNLRAEYWVGGTVGALGTFLRLAGLIMVAAVLGGLAFVFHRESSRELRDASQRVGFVNQVSHELRTPLTNIRLYAELLQLRLDDDDENRSYLDIIVAESGRLSRLIGNVLSFAQRDRGALVIYPVEGSLDDTLRSVADQFRPSFEAKGVTISLDLTAPRSVSFDPDAIEQVVGNLLGNIEKYAAEGEMAAISSRQTESTTVVLIMDRGPGIPAGREEAVFEPFVRLSDRITEGVSGTGIGLAIARELARLHGGELRLLATEVGACFELELPDHGQGGSA